MEPIEQLDHNIAALYADNGVVFGLVSKRDEGNKLFLFQQIEVSANATQVEQMAKELARAEKLLKITIDSNTITIVGNNTGNMHQLAAASIQFKNERLAQTG